MRLAEKILNNAHLDEKVQPSFFDDMNAWATKSKKAMTSMDNKNAKDVVNMLVSIALSLDEVDEKGALEDIKKLAVKVKKLDVEG